MSTLSLAEKHNRRQPPSSTAVAKAMARQEAPRAVARDKSARQG
jgi:hypothetical protein